MPVLTTTETTWPAFRTVPASDGIAMTPPLGDGQAGARLRAELDFQVLQPAGGRAGRAPPVSVGQGDPERGLQHDLRPGAGPVTPAGHRLGGHQARVDVVGRHRLAHPDPQAAALEVCGSPGHLLPAPTTSGTRTDLFEQAAGPREQPGGQQS